MSSASRGFAPDSHQDSAPGPCWGTSVSSPRFVPLRNKFLATPLLAPNRTVASGYGLEDEQAATALVSYRPTHLLIRSRTHYGFMNLWRNIMKCFD